MNWLEIFQREDGCLSLGRITVSIGILVWFIISIHSYFTGKTWNHYDTFSIIIWVSFLSLIANKYVECKFLKVGEHNG